MTLVEKINSYNILDPDNTIQIEDATLYKYSKRFY